MDASISCKQAKFKIQYKTAHYILLLTLQNKKAQNSTFRALSSEGGT